MTSINFAERRQEYRIPYLEKVILSDGKRSATAHAANISRGGLFLMTLDPFPIDTQLNVAFSLPQQELSLCVRAKVAHIVFDRQRCEVECGIGVQFLSLTESQKSVLNLHVLNDKAAYQELRDLLRAKRPNPEAITRCMKRLPGLQRLDLLGLRYRVDRICTIFETHERNRSQKPPETLSA